MNFLAHLYLSCSDEDLLIGNFIADFIRNRELESYSPGVQQGIFLHREIDRYTDNHPEVRQGTRRLHPYHHKYAPVVIDIFYDYLLSHNWQRYSDQDFATFTRQTYQLLNDRRLEMPEKLQKRLPGMIGGDWLAKYRTEEGMRFTFQMLDKRTRFPSNFQRAYDHLMQDLALYEREFNRFFPEVIGFVNEYCRGEG